MAKPIVVASFSFPHEAQIARASLESAGIPAVVADEHTINMQWLYSNALGGVKVLVPPEQAEEARSLLGSDFSSAVNEACDSIEPFCHECGSSNIGPYTKGKKSAFVIFLLAGFPLFFYKHGLKCEVCGAFRET